MSPTSPPSLLLCPSCGHAHRFPALDAGECARCARCDTLLLNGTRSGINVALACTAAGLLLALPAALLPFAEVSKFQAVRASHLFSGAGAMWEADMHFLAAWVVLCAFGVPLLLLGTLAGLLLPVRFGNRGSAPPPVFLRAARALEHWAMPEVQVLALLVAFAKLGGMVHVRPGPGLWCYAAMTGCILVAWHRFEFCHAPRLGAAAPHPGHGPQSGDARTRHAQFSRSRARAAAFALAATVMLVPANLLPVISMDSPGNNRTDTIFSGIVNLAEQGLWPLAAIVFIASFLVPLLKLAGLGWLLHATRRPVNAGAPALTQLYTLLDFIGRWSMLDVFLMAFVAGAVRFGGFATVEPRPGIAAFAVAVVLTMLATDAFDRRQLWATPPARPKEFPP